MYLMFSSQDEVQGLGGIPGEGPVFHRQVTAKSQMYSCGGVPRSSRPSLSLITHLMNQPSSQVAWLIVGCVLLMLITPKLSRIAFLGLFQPHHLLVNYIIQPGHIFSRDAGLCRSGSSQSWAKASTPRCPPPSSR